MALEVSSGRPGRSGRSLRQGVGPDAAMFLHGFRCNNYHGKVTMPRLILLRMLYCLKHYAAQQRLIILSIH